MPGDVVAGMVKTSCDGGGNGVIDGKHRDARVRALAARLVDRRGKQVVFLAHCLLNENTRYLGGACRGGCVREIVDQCLAREIGIVQLPCPEQRAWGGVLKSRLLRLYGTQRTIAYRMRRRALPLMLAYTRYMYRRLARRIAADVADYQQAGYTVIGIVGVDGSPSCGVARTLDMQRALECLAGLDIDSATSEEVNRIVRRSMTGGSGLFIQALRRELARRHIEVPFLAHDLFAELDGRVSDVQLPPAAPAPAGSGGV